MSIITGLLWAAVAMVVLVLGIIGFVSFLIYIIKTSGFWGMVIFFVLTMIVLMIPPMLIGVLFMLAVVGAGVVANKLLFGSP